MFFAYLHFLIFVRILCNKTVFWERENMKKELILLESEYCEDGTSFEEILQKAIENYLKNFQPKHRQDFEDSIKYK